MDKYYSKVELFSMDRYDFDDQKVSDIIESLKKLETTHNTPLDQLYMSMSAYENWGSVDIEIQIQREKSDAEKAAEDAENEDRAARMKEHRRQQYENLKKEFE